MEFRKYRRNDDMKVFIYKFTIIKISILFILYLATTYLFLICVIPKSEEDITHSQVIAIIPKK